MTFDDRDDDDAQELQPYDAVQRPAHYQGRGGLEAIEAIEDAFGLAMHLSTAVKYIVRHEAKGNPVQDLRKAIWYVDRVWNAEHLPPPEPPGALSHEEIAEAFDLATDVASALLHLLLAARDGTDEARRGHLSACISCLEDAIGAIEDAEINSFDDPGRDDYGPDDDVDGWDDAAPAPGAEGGAR